MFVPWNLLRFVTTVGLGLLLHQPAQRAKNFQNKVCILSTITSPLMKISYTLLYLISILFSPTSPICIPSLPRT